MNVYTPEINGILSDGKIIRNKYLIFILEGKEDGIQVMYRDETIWCTQKAMATLFDVGVLAVNKHLNNIYNENELQREATISKMEIVQKEGTREVKRLTDFYNLDAIISVGYLISMQLVSTTTVMSPQHAPFSKKCKIRCTMPCTGILPQN